MKDNFDALIIGSGVGGICTAARLSHQGYRTLLVESLDRVGGRASTRNVDGFLLNTGALVIERGGIVEQTLNEVDVSLNLFIPNPETVLLWGPKEFSASSGLIGFLRTAGPKIFRLVIKIIPQLRPREGQSVKVLLDKFTKSKVIHKLIDNVIGAMFAAGEDDLPADVFLHYFTKGSSFKKIGIPVRGTIEVWKPLVPVIEKNNSEVWLNSSVKKLTVNSQGLVDGAVIERAGELMTISTSVAISNIGPSATVNLVGAEKFPEGYAEEVKKATNPASIITVHFACRKPLAKFEGLALVAKSRRLVYLANFSNKKQNRTPDAWYLYCGASVPKPATGNFALEEEKELLFEDLREHIPDFNKAKILAIDVTARDWPAQRAITGFDLPLETPITNLWNVGDGVKPWGTAGTEACALTAKIVAERISKEFPVSPSVGLTSVVQGECK